MVILYNHIKNTTVHLNIAKVSESKEDLDDSDDEEGEGYDTVAEAEDDSQITGSSKKKRKIGHEQQNKGSAKRKQRGEDCWYYG